MAPQEGKTRQLRTSVPSGPTHASASAGGTITERPGSARAPSDHRRIIERIRVYYQGLGCVRRGVCLLNAGRTHLAIEEFERAAQSGQGQPSLTACLAVAHCAAGNAAVATALLEAPVADEADGVVQAIRHAYALRQNGDTTGAVAALRSAVGAHPETAEIHFQLGILLAEQGDLEEAELRFTQAVTLDREHAQAMVNLALCCGARHVPVDAIEHLRRAQWLRPFDARIGLLLSQAVAAAQAQGHVVHVRAHMPAEPPPEEQRAIDELAGLVEAEPEFVDAFLALGAADVDKNVYTLLLQTLERALERQPEHAELHYHCGRVLDRLGRKDDAIDHNECAVRLDPSLTRALIELGRLYRDTDQAADAVSRLEQAVAAGADYADVHFMLGELYRGAGRIQRARQAFRRAILLNSNYSAACHALDALPL